MSSGFKLKRKMIKDRPDSRLWKQIKNIDNLNKIFSKKVRTVRPVTNSLTYYRKLMSRGIQIKKSPAKI